MSDSRILDLNGILSGETISFDADFFHRFFIELTSIMLFPKDSKVRDKYFAHYRAWVNSYKPIHNCQISGAIFNPFFYIEDMPIPEKYQKWIERIFVEGTMAGSMALTIYRFAKHKPDRKVGVNKARYLAEQLTQKTMTPNDKHFPVARSKMLNCWNTFGEVSHYWATYNFLALPVADDKLEQMLTWVSKFVSTSRQIRNVLTDSGGRKGGEAIFSTDSIWDFPHNAFSKATSIFIPGPTKEEIKLISKYNSSK